MFETERSAGEKIVYSFFELLPNHSYSDITVGQICKNARVSRRSFYRYFLTKDDMIISFFRERLKEYCTVQTPKAPFTFENVTMFYLNFWLVYKEELIILKNTNLISILLYRLKDDLTNHYFYFLEKKYTNLDINDAFKTFIVGGYISVIDKWIMCGMELSVEEIAELISNGNTAVINSLHKSDHGISAPKNLQSTSMECEHTLM